MKELGKTPTTNVRRRIHAAAEKCGWTESPDGPEGDTFDRGGYEITMDYTKTGAIRTAYLCGPKFTRVNEFDGTSYTDRDLLGESRRFADIIRWIGGDHA